MLTQTCISSDNGALSPQGYSSLKNNNNNEVGIRILCVFSFLFQLTNIQHFGSGPAPFVLGAMSFSPEVRKSRRMILEHRHDR